MSEDSEGWPGPVPGPFFMWLTYGACGTCGAEAKQPCVGARFGPHEGRPRRWGRQVEDLAQARMDDLAVQRREAVLPAACPGWDSDPEHYCAGRWICPSWGGPPDDPEHSSVWAEGGMCSCGGCLAAKNRAAGGRRLTEES